MKQRIIVFANQKGGVGKTTTTVNLAAALALTGRRVLLVDMDPQGNASTHLGAKPTKDQLTTYELLLKEAPFKDVVVNAKQNIDILPTDIRLADAEIELPTLHGKDVRLKMALESATDYHYILIDSPPSLGQLTLNALTAAKELMVVVEAEVFAFEAVAHLMKTVGLTQKYCNPDLKLAGVICTNFQGNLNLNKEIYDLINENFGAIAFKTAVRKNVKLGEAPAKKKDIFEFDDSCTGAQDYAALCKELIAMEGRSE